MEEKKERTWQRRKGRKGFTLVELIVVMAVIGILVLLAAPRFIGQTKEAQFTKHVNNAKVLEDASERYYIDHGKWPRGADEDVYTAEEVSAYAERIYDITGEELTLEEGNYWDIDYSALSSYAKLPDESERANYVLRNPVGKVFYLEELTEAGETRLPDSDGQTPSKPESPKEPTGEESNALPHAEWLAKVQAEGYVLATDADFSGETDGAFKYIGPDKLVIVPNVIKGVDVTSYKNMFEKTYAEGVASYNPNITNMAYMFYNSYAPTLDVSRLNTTGVTDMRYMFCVSQATTLDLSGFDTSQVTNMHAMFSGSQATTMDVSDFDTSRVTNMYNMFYGSKATTLDLSSFDTAKVTTMNGMFSSSKATTLDLSSFDTAKVADMRFMFENSKATTGIARTAKDANRFNSSSYKPAGLTFIVPEQPVNYILATDADFTGTENGTFRYNGTNHYVIMPDTINGVTVTSYKNMFENSDVRGVISDNPNITNMAYMFNNSYAPTLDVSRLNTTGVTDMSYMFSGSQTTTLDLSSFDTAKVTDMRYMFYGSQATTLDLSSFDTSQVTSMSSMFDGSQATTMDLSSFDTAKVSTMSRMFYGSQATTLDLSSFDTTKVTAMSGMFQNSKATVGYARTTEDANRLKNSNYKPAGLTFTVK